MNLYDVTVVLTVEAENADEASDKIDAYLWETRRWWIRDYEIPTIRTLPLVREDSP